MMWLSNDYKTNLINLIILSGMLIISVVAYILDKSDNPVKRFFKKDKKDK